ncbi:MAG: hypothetical protein QOE45_17 [Frankiaceae bacterium]|nr:hypothetical protein [Frankiaceae bacterium]
MTVQAADLGVGVSVSRDEALRAFCEAEYAGLLRYCRRLCDDDQTARDLAQEAFVRLFGRWVQVREPRAYLYLVATNLARRSWRRRRSERVALTVAFPRDEPVAAHEPGIRDVVDGLPRKWRDPVLLHYYGDLPVSEVAHQLGEPEGTVKRRLAEARSLLAKQLGDAS